MWPWWVMIPIEDLTDVTLAVEDTNEDDEEVEDDEKDLTDVTLVSDDTYWRLDWWYSGNWGSDESYQVMKVIKWWKLSSDESYQKMKVIKWLKLLASHVDCLNSPSISWRGCWLGPLYDCVCLFVFYICICLLYLYFVFVSVSVLSVPFSSSLSSFMLIIIIYLCDSNLSSPSSAPYPWTLLLQITINCQRL